MVILAQAAQAAGSAMNWGDYGLIGMVIGGLFALNGWNYWLRIKENKEWKRMITTSEEANRATFQYLLDNGVGEMAKNLEKVAVTLDSLAATTARFQGRVEDQHRDMAANQAKAAFEHGAFAQAIKEIRERLNV